MKNVYSKSFRAGKTEVLTDDLQAADKHVEQIRAALTGLSKRLGNNQNQTVTQDPAYKDKRLVGFHRTKHFSNFISHSKFQ